MPEMNDSTGSTNRLVSAKTYSKTQKAPRRDRRVKRRQVQQAITVRFVLHTLRQWWMVALPVGLLLATAAGGGVYLLFEEEFKASAWLEIKENTPYIIHNTQSQSRQFVGTQTQLISSPFVLGEALNDPDVKDLAELREARENGVDPLDWIRQGLSVDAAGRQSELYTISFTSHTRENAALVANAVVRAYYSHWQQRDVQRTQRVIELLEEARERHAKDVERLRDDVRRMTKAAVGVDPYAAPSERTVVLNDPLAELQTQLTNAQVENQVLDMEIAAFQEMIDAQEVKVSDSMVAQAVEGNAEVQAIRTQIQTQTIKLEQILKAAARGKEDPFYQQLAARMTKDEETLAAVRAMLVERVRTEMTRGLAIQRRTQLEQMQSRKNATVLMEDLLRKRYEEEFGKKKLYSGETVELAFQRAELSRAVQTLDMIATRAASLRTEQKAPAQITPLQDAIVPGGPIEKFPVAKFTMAALIALLCPFGLAVLWERMVRRVNTIEELEQDSRMTVVGEIARLPVRTKAVGSDSNGRLGRGLRIFEESVDGLRTCLMLSESLRDMKVLAITSASKQEGKTSISSQLAVSIARASGAPTLLIDGDMRSPDIHNVFEIPLEPGFAQVLGRECTLEDAIVTGWNEHLHILPAGRLLASPHKLLGNGELKELLDSVRSAYRYIILDTPPILAASESLVMARAADASLVCAMRDTSRVDRVRMAHERLVAAGSQPIGTVLNGVPTSRYAYRYGTYAYARD
ncbi:MAG: polysaccharide biosynthesis tyrosine autokinase [Candidatus Nealsonbacteria bacterium]|nr:polysaccharide biosynthesis tyrosine autokinase [Candidatus Nealsonbacteria bacterium]